MQRHDVCEYDGFNNRPSYTRYQYLTPTARPLLGDNAPSRAMDYDRQRRQYLRNKTLKGYRNFGSGVACNVDVSNVNDGTGWDECYAPKSYYEHHNYLPRHDYPGRRYAAIATRDSIDYGNDIWAPVFSARTLPQRSSYAPGQRYELEY